MRRKTLPQKMPQTGRAACFGASSLGYNGFLQANRGSRLLCGASLMPENSFELSKIDWKHAFPWVRLFRAFHTAIDLRMLLLGSVAVVLLACGDAVFSHLPFAPPRDKVAVLFGWDNRAEAVDPRALPDGVLRYPWRPLLVAGADWGIVLRPARTIVIPLHTILRADATWSQKAFGWTRLLWALCVWAVIAGAMCRIAAVEHARDTKISLRSAVSFALMNFPAYITATLLPVGGIAIFWVLCLIGGFLGWVPAVGPPVLGLLWGLELLFGFVMALILIGAAAGWPLMYATISTEASDGFDGFSRAYSYVFSRPWHYLWFTLVALVYGSIVVSFVYLVAWIVTYLSAAGVASSLGNSATGGLVLGAPDSVGGPGLLTGSPSGHIGIGTYFAGAWLQAVGVLVSGFVASYFWTAATVIYLLLRQVDDATDFHEVYMPEEKEADDLLPLVGVAASDQPVIERPAEGDFASRPAAPGTRAPDGHQDPPQAPAGTSSPSHLPAS
jgi:hypothetical protein